MGEAGLGDEQCKRKMILADNPKLDEIFKIASREQQAASVISTTRKLPAMAAAACGKDEQDTEAYATWARTGRGRPRGRGFSSQPRGYPRGRGRSAYRGCGGSRPPGRFPK